MPHEKRNGPRSKEGEKENAHDTRGTMGLGELGGRKPGNKKVKKTKRREERACRIDNRFFLDETQPYGLGPPLICRRTQKENAELKLNRGGKGRRGDGETKRVKAELARFGT